MATKGGRPENLKPATKETAKDRGRAGGIASGKAKRRRKTVREVLKQLCGLPCTDRMIRRRMMAAGLDDDDLTNGAALALAIYKGAAGGSPALIKQALEILGEEPYLKLKEKELHARQKDTDAERPRAVVRVYLPDNGRDERGGVDD